MKLKPCFYLLICLFTASCKNTPANSDKNSRKTSLVSCYQHSNKSDTVTLKIIGVGESLTGTLVYKADGVIKTKGTILGSMRGDLLVANYTIMYEDSTSVKQIAFKKETHSFVEGFGETNTVNGIIAIKNFDSLQFYDHLKLVEIDCR